MTTRSTPLRLLFVCTHNSARSILAEGLANRLGAGRLRAFSAGSHPSGRVHPLALKVLRERGCDTMTCQSKSWDEFAASEAEPMDAMVTVCDNAAGEACPFWPGAPVRVHWGLPDPAHADGSDAERLAAFRRTAERFERRLRALLVLPLERFQGPRLQSEFQRIHATVLQEEPDA